MYTRKGRGRGFYQRPKRLEPTIPPSQTDGRLTTTMRNQLQHGSNCCGEITMNLELDCEGQMFFEQLKQLWKMLKQSPPVINLITKYYLQYHGNPYEQTLRLMYNCQDFYSAKAKSLPFFIIEQFMSICREYPDIISSHHLTPRLKLDAYKLLMKQNTPALTKLVAEAFEMASNGAIFIDLVKCMISKQQYKEACQSVIFFRLQDHFTLEDFLVPLIYQDKLFMLDDYLVTYPKHQEEIVVYLDNLLGLPSVRQAVIEFASDHGLPEVKWEKMQSKPFKKLIARLVKKFDLPSYLTPNLNKRRNAGTLQFLLQKRYIEEGFSDESWKEMVLEAVGDDHELHKELVTQVACYGDFGEALKWAHFYHIDREFWPNNVRLYADDRWTKPIGTGQEETEYWDEPQQPVEYYKFHLEVDDILLVDSARTFHEFLDPGLRDVDIVGLDCEWKPSFGGQKNELALMQISTRNKVYILDVPALSLNIPHVWRELDTLLFKKCDILKLGFGFTSDMSVIKDSISGLSFSTKQIGFLDLLSLWKQLDKPEVALPYVQSGAGPSLSSLVQQCFGLPLDKSEQFSNWEKRPLRTSQLIYAALDAYCLIGVYDVMKRCCENGGFPFEEVCYNLMTNDKTLRKKHKKPNKKDEQKVPVDIPQPKSHILHEVSAEKIKFVCDTMLHGLGKKLRRCGIDTIILENNQDHMECVRAAQDMQRYILTRGTVFNKLVGCVSPGFCYKVISDNIDVQIKEVLEYYRIKVSKEHVFSRCQFCNGNSFVKVCRSTMRMMVSQNSKPRFAAPPPCFMDEATGFSSDEDYDDEPGYPVSGNRKWDLYPDEKIDVGLCETRLGVQIQMANIPEDILNNVAMFYICEECGKVYWDGSHYGKVINGVLHDIVQ